MQPPIRWAVLKSCGPLSADLFFHHNFVHPCLLIGVPAHLAFVRIARLCLAEAVCRFLNINKSTGQIKIPTRWLHATFQTEVCETDSVLRPQLSKGAFIPESLDQGSATLYTLDTVGFTFTLQLYQQI